MVTGFLIGSSFPCGFLVILFFSFKWSEMQHRSSILHTSIWDSVFPWTCFSFWDEIIYYNITCKIWNITSLYRFYFATDVYSQFVMPDNYTDVRLPVFHQTFWLLSRGKQHVQFWGFTTINIGRDSRSIVMVCWTAGQLSRSDWSCTETGFVTKFIVSPCYPWPSIASQCRIGLKHLINFLRDLWNKLAMAPMSFLYW